jgi:hypothetical protein
MLMILAHMSFMAPNVGGGQNPKRRFQAELTPIAAAIMAPLVASAMSTGRCLNPMMLWAYRSHRCNPYHDEQCIKTYSSNHDSPPFLWMAGHAGAHASGSPLSQAVPGAVGAVRGVASMTRRPADVLSFCRTCAL